MLFLNPFAISEKNTRSNSNKLILFNKTLQDKEKFYRDVGGYDMSYDDFREICCKSWEDD